MADIEEKRLTPGKIDGFTCALFLMKPGVARCNVMVLPERIGFGGI